MTRHVPGRGTGDDDIIVRVPVQHRGLAESMQALVNHLVTEEQRAVGGRAVDYGKVEDRVAADVAAIERESHAGILRSLEIDAPMVKIGGKLHVRIGHGEGVFKTLSGPVSIHRALYRPTGERNGKAVDAITLRTGAIGRGWLPRTGQAIAYEMQRSPSREAAASGKQTGKLPYSAKSFDRVAHLVGADWVAHHADLEDQLTEIQVVPGTAAIISASLDRVSVPMAEPRAKPVGRPRKNAPKRPIEVKWRMAYCGAVTIYDEDGEVLSTLRFGCMPQQDARLLCDLMANDVYILMQKHPGLKLILLADGAQEMWNLLEGSFPENVFGERARLVDFWHLMEKLAPAAKLIHGEEQGTTTLHRWKSILRKRKSSADEILDELQSSGCERKFKDSKQPVHEAITYLQNHRDRMFYASARRQHLPIGSGSAEATCKCLATMRMKRPGARWNEDTGEHILKLRALAFSDRWDSGMDLLHAQRRTAVRQAA
jgi:hypothetical protein